MARKIRVGIIGANANYGWSKRAHLPALLGLPQFELTAVCTSRPETAKESAEFYGAKMAFHDYTEMANHRDIDLVSISVSVPAHYGMVTAGLEAGKHVFCEWPLGANTKEAEELAGLARSKGVRNMVGLQARGGPALQRIKELVAEGYVGEVLFCNMAMFNPGLLQRGSDRAWMADREKGANTLTIGSGHALDIFAECVGEFRELSAQLTTQVPEWDTPDGGRKVPVTASDNVMVTGVLEGGAAASVHVATVPWNGTGWRMEIYGRDGTLAAHCEQMVQYGDVKIFGSQGSTGRLEELSVPSSLKMVPNTVPQGEPLNVAQLYQLLGESIVSGMAAEPDFDTAVKRHKFLDILQDSSDRGVRVKL